MSHCNDLCLDLGTTDTSFELWTEGQHDLTYFNSINLAAVLKVKLFDISIEVEEPINEAIMVLQSRDDGGLDHS